jgi:thiol-disulfide isomerase/thioredoxin
MRQKAQVLAASATLAGLLALATAVPDGPGRAAAVPERATAAAPVKREAKAKPVPIISEAHMRKAIGGHKGRVVVLHMWATWCIPCLDELPLLARFAREMKPKGVEVVSISLDDPVEAAAWKVGRVLHEKNAEGLASSIVKVEDADKFIASVDPRWDGDLPALFAFDRDGNLRRAFVGEPDRAMLDKFVADLLPPSGAGSSR